MNDRSNSQVTRRRFLQGAAAVGMGSVAPGLAGEAEQPKLPTKPLGRTKLAVTKVSYGSLHTSGGRGEQVLKLTVDAGVNMVHNSSTYRGGNAIRAMGEVFAKNPGMRDKLVLCLKGAHTRMSGLRRELEGMLKALHTDHTDVYLPVLHKPEKGQLDKLRTFQDDLKRQGKIRFTGFVCHGAMNDVLEMVLAEAPDYFDAALLSTQMIMGARGKTEGEEVRFVKNLAKLKKRGLGVISMKSKAREAMAKGLKVFQAHCKALLAGGADTVLFTFATLQQVHTLKKLDLTATAMALWERRLADEFHHSYGKACLMCSACTRSCPQGIAVNDLMRIQMYHDEHHDVEYARQTYRELEGDAGRLAAACTSCTACKGACPVGLAGGERVRYVTSLFA